MIKISNLKKKFGDFTAVDNISCEIKEGLIYGIVGSNGAGKSTFLRMITGVYEADGGEVIVDDVDIYRECRAKENIVYLSDDLYFLPGKSMKDMAKIYNAAYSNYDMKRFEELSNIFKLDINKSIGSFSKGMKRQAAIILALATRAKYIIFDETFDGLDPVMRRLVKNVISEEILERKATVILSSHSLRELEDLCDQLALLHKGKLILQNDVCRLKTDLFKLQIAFKENYDKELFEGIAGLDIKNFKKLGAVSNIIVRGDKEKILDELNKKSPILMETLPLTLEEVFIMEMDALGYNFEQLWESDENEQ